MIATCTNCQARYQLENAKIPARVIQVRCPACQGVFALDGNKAVEEESPFQATSTFEAPAQVQAPAPVEPVKAVEPEPVPEPVPFQPSAVVEPAPSVTSSVESAPASAPASAGVATLDEPVPASVSSRRRRCKEEMLARALVSDILVYNRETRDAGLEEGNLLEALGGEIKKSWELYKEKVTPEVANSTTYFREALNDILADGDQVF